MKGRIRKAQGTGHRAQSTGHRAQGTGHRAQSTGYARPQDNVLCIIGDRLCITLKGS